MISFTEGPRYIKAFVQDGEVRSALAFFDKQRDLWLEAASWKRPGVRLSSQSAELTSLLSQQ